MNLSVRKIQGTAILQERIQRQIEFLVELDKLKEVHRRTQLIDRSRRENSAEHSWHVAVFALVLAEAAKPSVDIGRVLCMLLLHDIVEIDAGDTFLYDRAGNLDKEDRESRAAGRIFGILPLDTGSRLRSLWEEFEARKTPDAQFAATMDRLQPLLQNYFSGGGTWRSPSVTPEKVYEKKSVIKDGSPELWELAQKLIALGEQQGYFESDEEIS